MKKTLTTVLLFTIIGLVIGYLLFGKIAGEYVSLGTFFKPASNELVSFGKKLMGISEIRKNIFISGGVGALVGFIYNAVKK
ncbi:hypothetical protein [Sediminitomix flava]|uniref:DUF4321 domain-containing protein n=1 Tax=Sediminitomix flava TaxID=379075 RepID=A0A315Z1H9_SEDFL|nr:hypothetical protein [Sediminitomix flava]PWJ36165.1 hypothetical protein BC781_109184 [Sediminitomix flava]